MGAETVIKKIQQIAAGEVEEILSAGQLKAKAAEEEIVNEAAQKADEIKSAASDSAAVTRRAAAQRAELDGRIGILNAKHELLAEIRAKAKERMLAFDDKRWTELYARLIVENAMPGEVFVKIPQADKRKYTSESLCTQNLGAAGLLLDILGKRATEKQGETVTLRLDPEFGAIDGGVILRGNHYDTDLSYDTVLDEIFERHEKKIADCLFGDGAGTS